MEHPWNIYKIFNSLTLKIMNTKFVQAIACLSFFALLLAITPISYATTTSIDSSYNTPIYKSELNFTAVLNIEGKVDTSWTPYAPAGFNYYKVIRSTTNENPVYPDDGYIKADSNPDASGYTDASVPIGTVYYRVCSIVSPDRYCSTVIAISSDGSSSTVTEPVTDNGYNEPIVRAFNFSAVLNDGNVSMSWDSYVPAGFTYYKVVRSTTNPEPVYPEDGYIKVSTNSDFTSYLDTDVPEGTVYYRICSIAFPDRYCSPVITVENGEIPTVEAEPDSNETTVVATTYTVTKVESEFADSISHQYNIAIDYLRVKSIVSGYDDGTFKPDNQINRAEFMKIVMGAKYASELSAGVEGHCFSDVMMDWYAPYVCLAKTKMIVSGYGDGNFRPAQNISFVEAAKILSEVYGLEVTAGSQWYEGYVKALQSENYIPSTVTRLDKPITRAEMAELIWRIKEQKKDQSSAELITESAVVNSDVPSGWATYYGDGYIVNHPSWYQNEKWGWDLLTDELDFIENINVPNYMAVDSYISLYTVSGSDLNSTVWFAHPFVSSQELTINGVPALKRHYRAPRGTVVNGRTTGENENITIYTYRLDGKVAVLQYFNAYGTDNYNVEKFYEIAETFIAN